VLRQINREHSYPINNACCLGMRIPRRAKDRSLCFCLVLDSKNQIGTFNQIQRSRLTMARIQLLNEHQCKIECADMRNGKGSRTTSQEAFYSTTQHDSSPYR
jgi:hypothetical protein